MSHFQYIGCNSAPTYNSTTGNFECHSTNSEVQTWAEVQTDVLTEEGVSLPLITFEQGTELAAVIWAASFLAWGFRIALKSLNIGV